MSGDRHGVLRFKNIRLKDTRMASRSSFQIREGKCVNIGVDDMLGNLREVVGSAVGLRTSPRSGRFSGGTPNKPEKW
jgi:hypothetical protein